MIAANRFHTYAGVSALAHMGQWAARAAATPEQASVLQEQIVDIVARRGGKDLPDLAADVAAEKRGQAYEVTQGYPADYTAFFRKLERDTTARALGVACGAAHAGAPGFLAALQGPEVCNSQAMAGYAMELMDDSPRLFSTVSEVVALTGGMDFAPQVQLNAAFTQGLQSVAEQAMLAYKEQVALFAHPQPGH